MSTMPYGIHPFWFWNGDLTADEIRRQVAEMSAQGVRGFYIHSRQGLQQPYLSASFMECVAVAIAAAGEDGLAVNLYDEYPYPSGVAGGEVVTGHPQFRATRLVQETHDLAGGPVRLPLPVGQVLNCTAYPLKDGLVQWTHGTDLREHVGMLLTENSYRETGLTSYNRKRYFASHPTPVLDVRLPAGPGRLYVTVQSEVTHHKYWGHTVDVLNPEAVAYFMQLTHERYARRFGEQFGTRIHSIFVDETTPGWSERLPEDFQAACGYDLLPLLPALQDEAHPQHLQVLADLQRVRYERFCATFEQPVQRWCQTHKLAYAGEKPSLRLAQLRYMDIPGCEPGHTKAGAPLDILRAGIRQNARATASAAYFYGKEGSLCECYHSLGWSGTLQDAKLIAEGLWLAGIRYLVPHGFFYTTHALAKHDAPPTFFFQMPYWPLFGRLAARIERLAQYEEGTHPVADVLLVDPTYGLPTPDQLQRYEALQQALMGAHLEFMMVDTDILQSATVADGRIHLRDVAVRLVLVPPMRRVEPSLRTWLEAFDRAGGQVLYVAQDAEPDAIVAQCLDHVRPRLSLTAARGDASRVWVAARDSVLEGLGRTQWFVLNTGPQELDVTLDAGVALHELPLEKHLPPRLVHSGGRTMRRIAPFESLLLESGPQTPAAAPPLAPLRLSLTGLLEVTPRSPNLLRLGSWEMALLDGQGVPGPTAIVPAVPLANQLVMGGLAFAPRLEEYFGDAPEWRLPRLRVRYRCTFENGYGGPVELVMEPGSIVGEWEAWANDGEQLDRARFTCSGAHVRGSLGLDITEHLCQGPNTLTVQVATDRMDGGLLNPLYLAGDFGVMLRPVRLMPRPAWGQFECYEPNALPYYAGIVEYETTFALAAVPNGEAVLAELGCDWRFQEAAEISLNGGPWRALPWSPRVTSLPTRELCRGDNRLRVRVYTTLIRSFEGQYFDPEAHVHRDLG